MKVLKITCSKNEDCHANLISANPNMVSIVHFPNNHILIDKQDYDNKGHVKAIAWKKDEELKLSPELQIRFREIVKREFVWL